MKKNCILGIDTSNYTTSAALVDTDGKLIANVKKLLPVKEGACGLRQSDALFFHTVQLPAILSEVGEYLDGGSPVAVGVSSRPRSVAGSYMPCFLAGVSAARAASVAACIPLYTFSHQCGHLMAALYSAGCEELTKTTFGAFHVSGGTTELLRASFNGNAFDTEIVGGTRDLNAGQAIDRVGVMLGLPFPCGPALERCAAENKKKLPPRKISAEGTYVNLSGLQNLAEKHYRETGDAPLTAAFTLAFIAESLAAMSRAYIEKFGPSPLLYAGGVMSNVYIKSYLGARFDARFAEPSLSSDNAVGIALLARRAYLGQEEQNGRQYHG